MEAGRLAGPPLADIIDLLQMAHDLTSDGGPHHFFRRTFCSIALSSVQVRHHALQLAVLVFKLLEAAYLGNAHAGVNLLPPVERRLRDPHLAADLLDCRAT